MRLFSILFAVCLTAPAPVFCQEPGTNVPPPAEQVLFEPLPVVEAAALHAQSLTEAPANVTVITAEDIRKYGYRTLAEALSGVRGFYDTYDHIYNYVGVRGISLPGDYNTRFLVMLNGHPLTDNVYSSNGLFGQDFGLDMSLVQRIEIIRGPSSALYGSNGMLANINVVTKSPVDMAPFEADFEAGSFGEKKASFSTSLSLGGGANLLLSSSVFNNTGEDVPVPEFGGTASGMDGEQGYHTFANLIWRDWSFTAYFNNREKQPPLPWGADYLDLDHRGNRVRDSRNFVRADYTRAIGAADKLRWELSYDQYLYDDRFDLTAGDDPVQDVRNRARGDWITSQLTYSHPVRHIGTLTAGLQATAELRNLQQDYVVSPDFEEGPLISHPDRMAALFAQQEWNLSRRWTAYLGARLDISKNYGDFVSPRLALVYQPSKSTAYKLVYGHPFRNPSAFEQYYNDNGVSFAASQGLRHETAQTFEASLEKHVTHGVGLVVNLYDYELHDLIQAAFLPGAVEQYENLGADRSAGAEFEISAKPAGWFETTASLAVQRASALGSGETLANSPGRVGKVRFAAPFLRNKLCLSSALQYLSGRTTRTGALLRPVALVDSTLTTQRLHPQFDLQLGLRNLMNWRYEDPVALAAETIRGTGRSAFVRLIWHPWD